MTGLKTAGYACLAPALIGLAACGSGGDEAASAARQQEIAALVQRLDALEREADLIKDSNDIKRLQRTYSYYHDAELWDQMADLFADDGTIEIGLDGVYKGKDRIKAYFRALDDGAEGIQRGELDEHFTLQGVVHVAPDGQTAKARWRDLMFLGEYQKSAEIGEGPMENSYVKVDGVWKIQSLHWYQTYMVPYAGGWAKNEDVNGGTYVSDTLPPDSPPTEQYGVWPKVSFPPFHYANPVTGRATGAGYE